MPQTTQWAEPRLADPDVNEQHQPDTETLLAELGAFYPMVSYPTQGEEETAEDVLDRSIFAGLVSP